MNDETKTNESEGFDNPPKNPMDALSELPIKRVLHDDATVTLHLFNAMDGWEMKRTYRDYLQTEDAHFRLGYTVAVLSSASLQAVNGQIVFLSDPATINEQLECWQNVEAVFHAVLTYNGIKIDPIEEERGRWQVAGEDMAKSFLAAVSDLMGPALKLAGERPPATVERGSDAA